jgi:hypothetical protein
MINFDLYMGDNFVGNVSSAVMWAWFYVFTLLEY